MPFHRFAVFDCGSLPTTSGFSRRGDPARKEISVEASVVCVEFGVTAPAHDFLGDHYAKEM